MKLTFRDFVKPDRDGRLKLNWDTFGELPSELASRIYYQEGELILGLEEFDILGHDGLIWLLSLAAWRHSTAVGPTYIFLPTDPAKLDLLRKLRFPQATTDAGGTIANEHVLWGKIIDQPYPYSLRYFQLIADSSWYRVATTLVTHFEEDLRHLFHRSLTPLSTPTLWPLIKSLHELLHNVAIHGGAEQGDGVGFACYRAMPRGFPLLRFCTTDLGSGFSATLKEQGLVCDSEIDAICHSLILRAVRPQEGVLGLYRALRFIRLVGGALRIRSGNILLSLELSSPARVNAFDEGYESPTVEWIRSISSVRQMAAIPGSHVTLDLRIPSS